MGAALSHLVDQATGYAGGIDGGRCTLGRCQSKAHIKQSPGDHNSSGLIPVLDRYEYLSGRLTRGCQRPRQLGSSAQLRLNKGLAKGFSHPHHLTGRLHLRPQNGVDAGKLDEGEDRLFDTEIRRRDLVLEPLRGQRLAHHAARRDFGQGNAGCLGYKGHCARGPRVDFQHIDQVLPVDILNGKLDIHQAHHVQGLRHLRGLAFDLVNGGRTQAVGRQGTGRVATVHARLLNMFHHATNEGAAGLPIGPGVAQAINVTFDCIAQKAVKQHRRVMADLDRLAHVALQITLFMHDFHGAAAQNIAGTDHQRVAQGGGFLQRLGLGAGGGVGRLAQLQGVQQFLEALPVLSRINHVRRGADDGHPVGLQVECELERRLPAILDDDAQRFLLVDYLKHVLQRERLKVQTV